MSVTIYAPSESSYAVAAIATLADVAIKSFFPNSPALRSTTVAHALIFGAVQPLFASMASQTIFNKKLEDSPFAKRMISHYVGSVAVILISLIAHREGVLPSTLTLAGAFGLTVTNMAIDLILERAKKNKQSYINIC